MNRVEVLEAIEPMARVRGEVVEPGPNTRIVCGGEYMGLRRGKGTRLQHFTPTGRQSFLKHLGLSQKVADRLSPGTLQTATTELVQRYPAFTILVEDGRIADVLGVAQFRPVAPERALVAIERGAGELEYTRVLPYQGGQGVEIEAMGFSEAEIHRARDWYGERPRVNDIVRGGLMARFSPGGYIEPSVAAHVVRLVCTNGLTHTEIWEQSTGGGEGGGDIWGWFRTSARQAIQSLAPIAERYRALAEQEIDPFERAEVLEGLIQEAGIRGEVRDAILAQAIEQPPETEWDMLNLITWATTHAMEDTSRIRRAQQAATRFADVQERRSHVCPTCNRRGGRGHAH